MEDTPTADDIVSAASRFGDARADVLKAIDEGGAPTLPMIWDRVRRRHSTDVLREVLEELMSERIITGRRDGRFITHYSRRESASEQPPAPAAASAVERPDVAEVARRLEEKAARQPAAVKSADEAPAPTPAPPKAKAGKPAAATPRTAPKSKKHGDMREAVFNVIASAPEGLTIADACEKLGVAKATAAYHFNTLAKAKRIHCSKSGNRLIWRARGAAAAPVERFVAKKRTENKVKAGKARRSVSAAVLPREALDDLERRLTRKPVERVAQKVSLLERLERMLDPAIAAVLAEIRGDLQSSAGAAAA